MKYLRSELKTEFERISHECPDLEDLSGEYVNVTQILQAYFILADYFTDRSSMDEVESMLVGIRDYGLLISAIGRQNISFAGKVKYSDKYDICATLFYGLVKNHAFLDGNKRVAFLILLYHLQKYGIYPTASGEQFEELVLSVAESSLAQKYPIAWSRFEGDTDANIKTISLLLRKMTAKKDHSYHTSPTQKEFCGILQEYGVRCVIDGGKAHLKREVLEISNGNKATYTATMAYKGDTRTVGAGTARAVLQDLHLYREFPNYQAIFEGATPMYEIVDQFSIPLRRLKDE